MKLRVALLLSAAGSAGATTPDAAWCPPPARVVQTAADDFRHGLANWRIEAQDARAETQAKMRAETHTKTHALSGLLDVQTPVGISLWWRHELSGDYAVRFNATPLPAPPSAGALAGRVSDLNLFWNATEADGREPQPRNGAFAAYDSLRAYYVGFGANGNTTTRLRFYDGQGRRDLLDGYADGPEATPQDRRGAMTAATRLVPGRSIAVELISRRPTAADPVHLRWSVNGHVLFERTDRDDAAPLLRGWFALRSTASRFEYRDFQILHCRAGG